MNPTYLFLSLIRSYIPLFLFVVVLGVFAWVRVASLSPKKGSETDDLIGKPFLVTRYPKEVLFNQYLNYSKNITLKIESPFESSQNILPGHCIVPTRIKLPKESPRPDYVIVEVFEYHLDINCENKILLFISQIKYRLIERYQNAVKFPYSALVLGMTIGYEDELTPELNNSIRVAGLSHVLVVSGYNFSLLTIVIRKIFSVFGRKIYFICMILILLVYFFLCGPEPPASRALFMSFTSLIGLIIGRVVVSIYILVIGYLFFIICDPNLILNASFNLSFTATVGLVLSGWTRYITTSSIVAMFLEILHVNLFIFPIITNYFGEYHLGGIIMNLLLIDLIPIITFLGIINIFTLDPILSLILYMTIDCILISVNIWQSVLGFARVGPIMLNMTAVHSLAYYTLLLLSILLIYLWIWRFRVLRIS